MLRAGQGLETRVARHRGGQNLKESDLKVPREVLHRRYSTGANVVH